jgi:Zn-dependent protease
MSEVRIPVFRLGAGVDFRLGRIPVHIDASFLLVSVLMASSRLQRPLTLVSWIVVVFVSILVHELGHALAFRAAGYSARIELHGMGGLTHGDGRAGAPSSARSVAISLAGPAAGFLLGGAVWLVGRLAPALAASPTAALVLGDALWINVGWGIANLLPILPLDGGQALRAVLDARMRGRGRAARATYLVSTVTAVAAGGYALWAGSLWGAFLAATLAVSNGRALRALWVARRDAPLQDELARASDALARGDPAAAERLATAVLPRLRSAPAIAHAAHVLTAAALDRNDADAALRALAHFPPGAVPHPDIVAGTFHMVQEALFRAGRLEDAAEVGRDGFARFAGARFAYDVACSEALLGRPAEAALWIERAIGAGWRDLGTLDADPDLAPLRADPAWPALRARLAP